MYLITLKHKLQGKTHHKVKKWEKADYRKRNWNAIQIYEKKLNLACNKRSASYYWDIISHQNKKRIRDINIILKKLNNLDKINKFLEEQILSKLTGE